MATKYGKTWWGEQWLGALKNIDYSNRLPRGASYARNGMVQEIKFLGNIISAKVKGSRRTPYSETIKLPEFSSKDIDKLIKLILEQPVVLSKLFNRQLDESLAKMAEKAGMPLFPKQWKDLKMNCSCPDWAVPCKHLAAVIYKTSMEIDNNPFLVFSLHGVDLMAELEKRGITAADSTEMMEVENTSAVYATMEQMQLRKV
ncbi:MAG: SWIM zinc finger family protein, partial [Prevotellaceae bacterium]|nr:SWIM zinc finger family protein [Prevotellaceae bacterium]MDY5210722.1 SWIM zinc finger family protein [Prevotella sp.]